MKLRQILTLSGLSLLGLWLGTNIVSAATSGPAVEPRDGDRAIAERDVPPVPAREERLAVPEGDYFGGSGVVEPRERETRLASQASGRVAEIFVVEGQRVEAGAPLLRFDDDVQKAALAAAEADLEAANAELSRTFRGNRKEDVEAAFAEADAARARAELSSGVAERLKKAAAGGGATPDEVDRATRPAAADRASSSLAEARKTASIAGSRKEDVSAARARVRAATARRDREKALLDERSVRSPIAGEVLALKVRVGEFYSPGGNEPLVTRGDTTQLRVRVDIDERDLARLRMGARTLVRVPAYPGRDFPGTIVEIGRRMGRKNVRSDDPVERNDAKILEAVVLLEAPGELVVGQRVTAFVSGGK